MCRCGRCTPKLNEYLKKNFKLGSLDYQEISLKVSFFKQPEPHSPLGISGPVRTIRVRNYEDNEDILLVNPTIIFEKEPDEKVVLKNIRTGMDPQAPDTVHRLPVDDAFNAENKFYYYLL